MASQFATDLQSGLDDLLASDLGETVSYRRTPDDPAAVDITVVWTEGGGVRDGVVATAFCRYAQFDPAPARGDYVVRGSRLYRVAEDPRDTWDDTSDTVTLALRFVQELPS